MLWPSIDSLYVSTLILFSLQNARSFDEATLLQRTQWLATTMYHENMICFYESCSKETLLNALRQLKSWNVVKIEKVQTKRSIKKMVSLQSDFQVCISIYISFSIFFFSVSLCVLSRTH